MSGNMTAGEDVPNTIFETRQGDIVLSLSAVTPASAACEALPRRAAVDISTREGNVDVSVVSSVQFCDYHNLICRVRSFRLIWDDS